MTGYKVTM